MQVDTNSTVTIITAQGSIQTMAIDIRKYRIMRPPRGACVRGSSGRSLRQIAQIDIGGTRRHQMGRGPPSRLRPARLRHDVVIGVTDKCHTKYKRNMPFC